MVVFSTQIYARIEAEYSNRYEVRDNALHLIINLRAIIQQPIPQATSQVPKFIVIPRLLYNVQLYRCDIEGRACSPVGQGSVYRGEVNWLVIPCYTIPCSREAELPIILDKELIDKLVSITEGGERPAFQVVFSSDPYTVPHAVASVPLPNANADVMATLDLNLAVHIKPQFIVLSSDDVKRILNSVKYFERVKIEVEVKLPETTEGLPKPLIDAVNTLRNAQEYLRNLDFARAIEACRNALYDITDKVDDKNVIKADVRKAILDKYEDHAGSIYGTVLEKLEVIIRNTLGIMSKFIHESGKVQFNPGINDATYLCRQVIEIINYLVELSRGR
jgi:hypothetical protein